MCNYRRTSKLERFNFTETKKPIRGSSVCCSKVIHASDYAAVAVAIAAAIIPLATRTNAHIHSPLFPTAVFQRRVYARARAHARIPVSRTRFHIRKSMVTPNVPSETRYMCGTDSWHTSGNTNGHIHTRSTHARYSSFLYCVRVHTRGPSHTVTARTYAWSRFSCDSVCTRWS